MAICANGCLDKNIDYHPTQFHLPLDLVVHLDGAEEALVARLGARREEGEVGPLESQVLRHVLVDDGVGLAAVEHVLEVVAVDDLEEGDVVVLGAVEGDDQEDVVVDVAEVPAVAVPQVDARAEALDGPRRKLLVLVGRRICEIVEDG